MKHTKPYGSRQKSMEEKLTVKITRKCNVNIIKHLFSLRFSTSIFN